MVAAAAVHAQYNPNTDEYGQNSKTLCEWVRNFRIKRMQMKRKVRSGGDLRVCAILSTALISAELELKRKQQERFQRWLAFQNRIQKSSNIPSSSDTPTTKVPRISADDDDDDDDASKINNISRDNIDVDVVSEQEEEHLHQNVRNHHPRVYNCAVNCDDDNRNNGDDIINVGDDDACQKQQDDEITNLWKCELVELDRFMRRISSGANSDSNNYNDISTTKNRNAEEGQPRSVQVYS